MAELKNALRSGDMWVLGSRQFRDFEDYLLPREEIRQQSSQGWLELTVPSDSRRYLDERLAALRGSLAQTDALAREGELPDVELTERGLSVTPLVDAVPEAAERLIRDTNALLPHVKITDLAHQSSCRQGPVQTSPAARSVTCQPLACIIFRFVSGPQLAETLIPDPSGVVYTERGERIRVSFRPTG